MSATLQNAPLIELLAEVRWQRASEDAGTPAGVDVEGFFGAFAGAIAEDGYVRSERLLPLGSPMLTHQSVYRFKKLGETGASRLYQIGPAVFSANAVVPYESWEKFAPMVERGIDRLLETRAESEKTAPFSSINLRYIDLFDSELAEGRTPFQFAKDVLKIEVQLPEALTRLSPEGAVTRPILQFQIPLNGGFLMSFSLGEGVADGRQGIIMDMSVATTVETAANAAAVMAAFSSAHDIIHNSFNTLIEPIRHLMPKKVVSQ